MVTTPLSVLRVMVVDDQRTMRAILRDLLHKVGIREVLDATDGENALAQLNALADKDKTPDLILCDLHMEKMDGLAFVTHVRRGKEEKIERHIPILLLTGENDTMMLEVVQQVGAIDILKKPISADNLGLAIAKAVGVVTN